MTKALIALLCLAPSGVVLLWCAYVQVVHIGRKRGWWR